MTRHCLQLPGLIDNYNTRNQITIVEIEIISNVTTPVSSVRKFSVPVGSLLELKLTTVTFSTDEAAV